MILFGQISRNGTTGSQRMNQVVVLEYSRVSWSMLPKRRLGHSLVNPSLSSLCSIGYASLQMVGTGLSTQKHWWEDSASPQEKKQSHTLTLDFQNISTHILTPTPTPQHVYLQWDIFVSLTLLIMT